MDDPDLSVTEDSDADPWADGPPEFENGLKRVLDSRAPQPAATRRRISEALDDAEDPIIEEDDQPEPLDRAPPIAPPLNRVDSC